jgi:hypothetical protein
VLLNVITPLGALGIPIYGWLMDKKGFALSYAVINLLGIGACLDRINISGGWLRLCYFILFYFILLCRHQRVGVDPGAPASDRDLRLLGGLPAAGLLGLLRIRR